MQYELFYLVGASKEADLDNIKKAAAEMVTSEGGVFEAKQIVEKRKLAYAVKHENYGFYVAQRFDLEDTDKLKAINKKLNLYPPVLRFLITRAAELPELTSRIERKERESAKIKYEPRREKAVEVKKPAETKPAETAAEKQKPKASEEDIDKKLEEILNI